mmetsp:Transcript_43247/g.123282  ORF Transcript_43247/g.123282 Transcript_43247/m.123282 type:complete len:295 (+) Transcript_43247:797-1681(+)
MESCSTVFTAEDIEVKRSVVLPTRECRTDSASLDETSAATFFDIRAVLNCCRMGSSSSSVSTAPPVRFFTPRVSVLKSPPTRPGFPGSALAACSSPSELEERDCTSSSAMNLSPSSPEPRNSFCFAALKSSSSSGLLFFEKSRFFMVLLLTLPYSHWRASFFLGFSAAGSCSFSFFLGGPGLVLAASRCLTSEPAPGLSSASASSSSSSSSSFPDRFSFSSLPPFTFFLEVVVMPFSSWFFFTSLPFLVSAKDLIFEAFLDSWSSLSVFWRMRRKSASKSTCLMLRPLPKALPT